jgi:hypothetical protein
VRTEGEWREDEMEAIEKLERERLDALAMLDRASEEIASIAAALGEVYTGGGKLACAAGTLREEIARLARERDGARGLAIEECASLVAAKGFDDLAAELRALTTGIADAEVEAMRTCERALSRLAPDARRRVCAWLVSKYGEPTR